MNRYFPTLAGITVIGVVPDLLLTLLVPTGTSPSVAFSSWSLVVVLVTIFVTLWMTAAIYYFLMIQPTATSPWTVYRNSVAYVRRVFSTGVLQGVMILGLWLVIFILLFLLLRIDLTSLEHFNGVANPQAVRTIMLITLAGVLASVPAVYLSVRWQFSTLLVITENIANWSALRRSGRLVRGRWWGVFGRFFLFGLLIGVVVSLVNGILSPLAKAMPLVISMIQSLMTNVIIGPLVACFTVQLFNDLRQSVKPSEVKA